MGRLALLALGAFAMFALAVNAIAVTDDWWVIALTIVAAMATFTVIGIEVRGLMADEGDGGDDPPPPAPAYDGAPLEPGVAFTGLSGDDRAVVMTTQAATAADVLSALGIAPGAGEEAGLSVMVVVPEGVGHRNADNERFYAQARRAEDETVDALRNAGINATGHVGDHDVAQAITDALVLFGASRVVVLAGGKEAATLRAHLDVAALERQTRARIDFVELRPGRGASR